MIIDRRTHTNDPLNVDATTIEQSKRDFFLIIKDIKNISRKAEGKIKSFFSEKALFFSKHKELEFAIDIASELSRVGDSRENNLSFREVDYFYFLFVRTWSAGDKTEKKELIGRVIKSLDDDGAFDQLFNELITAAAFIRRGFVVELNSAADGDTKRHDMTVKSKHLELHIEVKTITSLSGKGGIRPMIKECTRIASEIMEKISTDEVKYKQLTIKYVGNNKNNRKSKEDAIKNLPQSINDAIAKGVGETQHWIVKFKDISSFEYATLKDLVLEKTINGADHSTGEFFTTGPNFLIEYQSLEKPDLKDLLKKHIDKAVQQQLPKSEYSSVHVFIAGTPVIGVDSVHRLLTDIPVKYIEEKLRRLTDNGKHSNLTGIHFYGDGYLSNEESGRILSYQNHAITICLPQSKAMAVCKNMFYFDTK